MSFSVGHYVILPLAPHKLHYIRFRLRFSSRLSVKHADIFFCDGKRLLLVHHLSFFVRHPLFHIRSFQNVSLSILFSTIRSKCPLERVLLGYIALGRSTHCFCCTTEKAQKLLQLESSVIFRWKSYLGLHWVRLAVIANTITRRQLHFCNPRHETRLRQAFCLSCIS